MAKEGKTLRKGGFKTRMENTTKMSTSGPESEPYDGEELGDNDAPD